jgi:hypothetical protein
MNSTDDLGDRCKKVTTKLTAVHLCHKLRGSDGS